MIENFAFEFLTRYLTKDWFVGFKDDHEIVAEVAGSAVQLTRRCLGAYGFWFSPESAKAQLANTRQKPIANSTKRERKGSI